MEESSISSSNSPKRLRHVEEKPTSNNNAPPPKYDVFVSFRGEIRDEFLSHLVEAFKANEINYFVDERLEKGEKVWPSIVKAIEESSISLILFSEDYASSRWCLEEVVTILKCRDEYGQFVIPVFYKVEPTNVRHQSSHNYKKAFDEYQRKNETNVQIWRDALKRAADINGFESSRKKEAELVKEIVCLVRKKKPVKPAVISKRLVGIDEKIAHLESLIKEKPKVTRVIGIWGMGGLGKTTLAEVVFHKLQHEYGGFCLLLNERDESNKDGLLLLRKEIFSQLLRYDVKIYTLDVLPRDIVDKTRRIKVLIVLDDVNDSRHIKKLLGNLEDFGLGSRIIITTRNEQVLKNIDADASRYKLLGLNSSEALELFNLNAFNKSDGQREYNKLLKRVVHYAQGIPLVLEVLAGHLHGNTPEVWEGELDKLEKMPHEDVYNVMKRSYDDLDREQKQSFLDIAFFVRSHHEIRTGDLKFLLKDDESGNSVVSNLEKLKEKALITFSKDNVVSMHDVLQETALEIVRRTRESIECLGSCGWLWDLDDIYEALQNHKVSEAIRSLQIPLPKMKEHNKLTPHIFANMRKLQFLEIVRVWGYSDQRRTLAEGLQFLSTKIRFLNFPSYPLKSLPENFSTEKLVVLKLRGNSMEKLWDDVKNLVNLTTLDLVGSKMLKELPDLSKAINLEVLLLERCSMLISVHPSIFSLPKLKKLDLNHCSSLTRLASDSHLCKFNYLNLSYCENLTELELRLEGTKVEAKFNYLDLSYCENLTELELRLEGMKVEAVPSLFEHQSKLELLNLCGTDIEKIPPFDNNLMQHWHVKIRYCEKLRTLPEHLPFAETLDLSGCSSLETLPKLPPSLKTISAENCKSLKTLPKLPPSLKTLNARYCKSLKTLPELPTSLETLDVCGCKALVTLPELPTSLKTLNVNLCKELETLPKLLTSLKTLNVSLCKELETLPELPRSLETLDTSDCLALESLPKLPTYLKTLNVSECKLLKTLPELPTFLETLDASHCRALEILPELPTSLKTLNVCGCELLKTLPKLPTSLKHLDESACKLLKTLPELPTSFKTLEFNFCDALETLPELPTSLETLDVISCEALETLPELPTSLKTLGIFKCSALETLPEFPTSIETLRVQYCKSLKTVLLFPSTAVEQLEENRKQVLFMNCLNLDEHSLVAIGLNAQINMMKFAHHHLSSPNHDHVENDSDDSDSEDDDVDNHVENHPDRAIYMYPGSTIPEWLKNKTRNDYIINDNIIIDLSSAPAFPRWGFIFCFVFGQYQSYITGLEVNFIISDEDGVGKKDSVRMYIDVYAAIESNHVCVVYDHICSSILNSIAKNQMRFKIQLLKICASYGMPRQVLRELPQGVFIKGFGVSPISSSEYDNFIQQMELRDRDSKYQIH